MPINPSTYTHIASERESTTQQQQQQQQISFSQCLVRKYILKWDASPSAHTAYNEIYVDVRQMRSSTTRFASEMEKKEKERNEKEKYPYAYIVLHELAPKKISFRFLSNFSRSFSIYIAFSVCVLVLFFSVYFHIPLFVNHIHRILYTVGFTFPHSHSEQEKSIGFV